MTWEYEKRQPPTGDLLHYHSFDDRAPAHCIFPREHHRVRVKEDIGKRWREKGDIGGHEDGESGAFDRLLAVAWANVLG
jgi:hypothetical protein